MPPAKRLSSTYKHTSEDSRIANMEQNPYDPQASSLNAGSDKSPLDDPVDAIPNPTLANTANDNLEAHLLVNWILVMRKTPRKRNSPQR